MFYLYHEAAYVCWYDVILMSFGSLMLTFEMFYDLVIITHKAYMYSMFPLCFSSDSWHIQLYNMFLKVKFVYPFHTYVSDLQE